MKNILIILAVVTSVFLIILALPVLFIKGISFLKYLFDLTYPFYAHALHYFGLSNELIEYIGLPIFIFAVLVFFISLVCIYHDYWCAIQCEKISQKHNESEDNPL